MKKIYILFVLLFSSAIYSQTKGITYQAVILNPEGEHIPGYNNERAPLTIIRRKDQNGPLRTNILAIFFNVSLVRSIFSQICLT
jgi:hypothetical protein